MLWWESLLVIVIWLTVKRLRRWRRSGHAALSSPQSRASSRRTAQSPSWLADADPSRIAHTSKCENCRVEALIPMSSTRLERRPWRLVWICQVCGRQSRALCHAEVVPVLESWDRAGGTSLSMREVADMVQVDLDELNAAIVEELL
jgi:RNase P subunit RPR2